MALTARAQERVLATVHRPWLAGDRTPRMGLESLDDAGSWRNDGRAATTDNGRTSESVVPPKRPEFGPDGTARKVIAFTTSSSIFPALDPAW